MKTFTPVNSLETKLHALLTDQHTPYWSFYTPLAAAPLWIITKNYPELDGSEKVAPDGQNPAVCICTVPTGTYIGLYTSAQRAEEIFEQWKISRTEMTYISAPGWQLLKFVKDMADDLWINAGLKECQYHLDPDMVEILLERPEPVYEPEKLLNAVTPPTEDLRPYLGPVEEFLGRQANVRAAWIFTKKPDPDQPAANPHHEIGLVMENPEDDSLLGQVGAMVKALTPVEMDWTTMLMKADDKNLRKLRERQRPFYEAPDFLKKKARGPGAD
jgi:hypothetical protein